MRIQLGGIGNARDLRIELDDYDHVKIEQASIETYIERGKGKYIDVGILLLIPEEGED